jgi:hypothetical protein
MMIKLTYATTKASFWIRAIEVRAVERNPGNLLETYVITTLMGPQGPVVYSVLESPEEVVEAVEDAIRDAPGVRHKLNG